MKLFFKTTNYSCSIPSVCQLLEAETMTAIFLDNKNLCNEVTERVIQHFVHCIETQGRHVPYLKFLQTVVKAEGEFIKKTQDMVMAEVHVPSINIKFVVLLKYMMYFVCTTQM